MLSNLWKVPQQAAVGAETEGAQACQTPEPACLTIVLRSLPCAG